jgi:hypothetical protein
VRIFFITTMSSRTAGIQIRIAPAPDNNSVPRLTWTRSAVSGSLQIGSLELSGERSSDHGGTPRSPAEQSAHFFLFGMYSRGHKFWQENPFARSVYQGAPG